jgi:hypothetical protein
MSAKQRTNGHAKNGKARKSKPKTASGGQSKAEQLFGGYSARREKDSDYFKEITKTEVGEQFRSRMVAEFDPSHMASYRNEEQIWMTFCQIRLRTDMFLQEHPPRGSRMTGPLRELVYGNSNEPLTEQEIRDVLAIEEVLIARLLTSTDMEQQRLIKEMRSENTVHRPHGGSGSTRLNDIRRKLGVN